MKKISFKYHPNVWEQDVFSHKESRDKEICNCCGQETEYFLENMYTSQEIDCICPNCIANGEAAKKFDVEFIQYAQCEKVDDKEKIDELFKRTPGYISWQGEYWLACCNDFCAYFGEVGINELKEMGIAEEVIKEYEENNPDDYYEDCMEYLGNGIMQGYLFKCLHCEKYHLWVDAD